jgi:hypothetical protein
MLLPEYRNSHMVGRLGAEAEPWRIVMPTQPTIHVFQCGHGSPYGFTNDRSGSNLPKAECREGWVFFKTFETESVDLPRIAVDIEQVHHDIAKTGYSVVPWPVGPG